METTMFTIYLLPTPTLGVIHDVLNRISMH